MFLILITTILFSIFSLRYEGACFSTALLLVFIIILNICQSVDKKGVKSSFYLHKMGQKFLLFIFKLFFKLSNVYHGGSAVLFPSLPAPADFSHPW